jgi:hypothetical protein
MAWLAEESPKSGRSDRSWCIGISESGNAISNTTLSWLTKEKDPPDEKGELTEAKKPVEESNGIGKVSMGKGRIVYEETEEVALNV